VIGRLLPIFHAFLGRTSGQGHALWPQVRSSADFCVTRKRLFSSFRQRVREGQHASALLKNPHQGLTLSQHTHCHSAPSHTIEQSARMSTGASHCPLGSCAWSLPGYMVQLHVAFNHIPSVSYWPAAEKHLRDSASGFFSGLLLRHS
jgi:hypothetical protein